MNQYLQNVSHDNFTIVQKVCPSEMFKSFSCFANNAAKTLYTFEEH